MFFGCSEIKPVKLLPQHKCCGLISDIRKKLGIDFTKLADYAANPEYGRYLEAHYVDDEKEKEGWRLEYSGVENFARAARGEQIKWMEGGRGNKNGIVIGETPFLIKELKREKRRGKGEGKAQAKTWQGQINQGYEEHCHKKRLKRLPEHAPEILQDAIPEVFQEYPETADIKLIAAAAAATG